MVILFNTNHINLQWFVQLLIFQLPLTSSSYPNDAIKTLFVNRKHVENTCCSRKGAAMLVGWGGSSAPPGVCRTAESITPPPADTPPPAHAQTARVPECTQHNVLLYQTIMIHILYAYVLLSDQGQTMHLLRAPFPCSINNML